jgi:hypothetical protein
MVNVVSLNQFKYQRYAKAVGDIDLRNDITYIRKINNKNFTKEYIKAYIKLLSK